MRQVISIYDLAGGRDVLAGAIPGKSLLAKLITEVRPPQSPEAVLLSFHRVNVATSSYLREAILGFRDYCTRTEPDLYPVVSDANEVITDELEFLLKLHDDALVVCNLDAGGKVVASRIIGHLNEKQRLTFEAVVAAGETDATKLQSRYKRSEAIQITGWNNRLASLVEKGVLMEIKKGRNKVYRPVLG